MSATNPYPPMRTNLPGENPHTINDLVDGVQEALQYKSTATPQLCAKWLRKAILNITENYHFTELEVSGPLVTVGPMLGFNGSNYQYLISTFLNEGDDYTLSEDPVIFLTPTQALSVGLINAGAATNTTTATIGYPMDYMSPKAIQPILFVPGGVPFRYTRYGNQFWFGPQPGQNYQVYFPYQRRHPFNEGDMLSSPLYFPTSWEQVMEYAAAILGAHASRWSDMIPILKSVLYGDPKNQQEPGLLKALQPQVKRDASKSTRQLVPVVSRY